MAGKYSIYTGIRLDQETYDACVDAADRLGMHTSSYIRAIIHQHFNNGGVLDG